MHKLTTLAAGFLLIALSCARCWADGGAVRAIERVGPLQISAFTSPNPLLAGQADISVLVQDAKTLAPVADAQLEITITPLERPYAAVTLPATAQAATNKLFRACLIELEPGEHEVEIICDTAASHAIVRFPLEVGAAPPQLAALWPWFTWPVVPIVLFALDRRLARRKAPQKTVRAAAARHRGP